MIGWNINDFTACIMCLIRPEEYSYQELTEVLEQILYNNVTTNLREYCGGSPVVIGYLEPQKFTKIPNLEIQKQVRSMPGQEKLVMDYYKKNPSATQSLKGAIYEDKLLNYLNLK